MQTYWLRTEGQYRQTALRTQANHRCIIKTIRNLHLQLQAYDENDQVSPFQLSLYEDESSYLLASLYNELHG